MFDAGFKPGHHGGRRYEKITSSICTILKKMAIAYPKTSLMSFCRALSILTGTDVNRATICRQFRTWGWSYHTIENKQLAKYITINLDQNGIERLKFIDEVHFVTNKLHRRKGVGPRGKIIAVSNNCDLKESFSMTLMTRMDNRIPFSVSMRIESNS